jgi:hypothetical protein
LFDRQRYEWALAQMDEALTLDDYYAGLRALAEAQGRVPDPRYRSHWPRGRHVAAQRSTEGPPAARMRSADVSGPSPAPAAGEVVREWSDFTITVGPTVLSRIEREIHEAVQAFDSNVETGGWLFAHYTPDAEGVPIIQATGPGRSARHSASRLTLAHPRELEDELASSAVLVGDWHTHPATWTGDPSDQASQADEEAWGGRLETLASSTRWVGLIFTPGVMGWTSPLYHGFLTHENEHGVVVCEQATVVEGQISPGWVP